MLAEIVCALFVIPATAYCLYYLVFVLAARTSRYVVDPSPTHRFAILIPAHNEQDSLPSTLRAVSALEYPPKLVRVYVVADNCSDETAALAALAGVVVLVRDEPNRRGKGFALAYGLEAVQADAPDAVLILDADCVLEPSALQALNGVFATGVEAVQLDVQSANADEGPAGYVAAVGDALERFVSAGRDRLGWSVSLRGTGMAFRLTTLGRIPWSAFSSTEDAEYDARLARAGVRVRFVASRVACAAPARVSDLYRQRQRWRGAIVSGSWIRFPIRAGRSKPLVLIHLFLTVAIVLATGEPTFIVWALSLVGLTAAIYLRAILAVGLSWRRALLLLGAPLVVIRLAGLVVDGLLRRRPSSWENEPPSDPPGEGHSAGMTNLSRR
jgi:cellulose synthase/poly-beta-1,6-N-acetylglucosamine synthase-like glycosyltransferase